MLYLFMSLWILFGLLFVGLLLMFIFKRKYGKLAFYSLGASVLCLIVGIVINAYEAPTVEAEQAQDVKGDAEFVIDANQFSLIAPSKLTDIMGGAESVDEWEFSSPNGLKYQATIYSYDNGNKEFMVIDDKVVRFTITEAGHYKTNREAMEIFGIKANPDFTVAADNGVSFRYRNVSEGIEEFWLMSDGKGKIETLKITYDLAYFE